MRIIPVLFILVLFLFLTVIAEDNYFYNMEGTVNIYPIENKIIVGFKPGFGNHFENFNFIYQEIVDSIIPEKFHGTFYIYDLINETNADSLINVMNTDSAIIWAHSVYSVEHGGEYAYTDQIAIQKRISLTQDKYDSLLNYYSLEEVGGCRSSDNIKYLRLLNNDLFTLLETANRLHENADIEFANPRFFRHNFKPFYNPADPLFFYQWNLKNNYYYDDEIKGVDIAMEKAWDITRGSDNITIAVLDDGFSIHHDFPAGAIINTIDYIGETVDSPAVDYDCLQPTADSLGHGYACSGLILAEHNDTGIAGIAPECKFIFIKVVDDHDNWAGPEEMGGALKRAAQEGADIISCSWGDYTGTGWSAVTKAIDTITNPDYMGFSCAVFFSSGNSGGWRVASPANLPATLAVGATDSLDTKWYYSQCSKDEEADSTLDVMAPSGNVPHWIDMYYPLDSALAGSIVTMDRPGDWGYNTFKYEPPYLPYT